LFTAYTKNFSKFLISDEGVDLMYLVMSSVRDLVVVVEKDILWKVVLSGDRHILWKAVLSHYVRAQNFQKLLLAASRPSARPSVRLDNSANARRNL
jgi:hypothetical protein